MVESLKVEARSTQFGCGIYEVGTEGFRMFITDGGRVIPVQGRAINAEDLIQAFVWGRMEEKAMLPCVKHRRGTASDDDGELHEPHSCGCGTKCEGDSPCLVIEVVGGTEGGAVSTGTDAAALSEQARGLIREFEIVVEDSTGQQHRGTNKLDEDNAEACRDIAYGELVKYIANLEARLGVS